jgi:Fe2+ or Zn2+ uptake regulation protein
MFNNHNHSFIEAEKRDFVYCQNCGKIKKTPHTHKWERVEERNYKKINTTTKAKTDIDLFVLQCKRCGEIKVINVLGEGKKK